MGDAKPNPDADGPVYSTTTPIQDDEGNTVVIPGGFHLDKDSGTSVEEGIVIEDAEWKSICVDTNRNISNKYRSKNE